MEKRDNEIIFLLGAGSSVDAGMPTVARLTKDFKEALPKFTDVNGTIRPEFSQIFGFIEEVDPAISENYEKFFEWIRLLSEIQKHPFNKIFRLSINELATKSAGELASVIGREILKLLEKYQSDPQFLSKFKDFLPNKGRLKVFSLNYDCCLEDACHINGIDITTGFDPITKRWDPSLFWKDAKGINLYKLHGSIRWFGMRDKNLRGEDFKYHLQLAELKSEERPCFSNRFEIRPEPELILGPGNKIQPDDPFITLFFEFQKALTRAKTIVIIGYSYRDLHVNRVLDLAFDDGIHIFDVNPSSSSGRFLGEDRYHHIKLSAKKALLDRRALSEIEKIGHDSKGM